MEKMIVITNFDGTNASLPNHSTIKIAGLTGIDEKHNTWSPPHLLVSAAETCFFLTFSAVVNKMRLTIKNYSSSTEGTVTSEDGKRFEVSHITIKPKITFVEDDGNKRLPQLIKMAEEYCLVARSLKTKISIEIQ